MPGTVAATATEGATVRAGQQVAVLEAVKMEHPVASPVDGRVVAITAAE